MPLMVFVLQKARFVGNNQTCNRSEFFIDTSQRERSPVQEITTWHWLHIFQKCGRFRIRSVRLNSYAAHRPNGIWKDNGTRFAYRVPVSSRSHLTPKISMSLVASMPSHSNMQRQLRSSKSAHHRDVKILRRPISRASQWHAYSAYNSRCILNVWPLSNIVITNIFCSSGMNLQFPMEGVKKVQSIQYMRTVEPDSIYSEGRTLLKIENLYMRLELVRLRGVKNVMFMVTY